MLMIHKKTKRDTPAGKGKEDTTDFRKIFDVLNYTPVRYGFLKSWLVFMDSAEGIFRKKLSRVSVDSLNAEMFDAYIEAMAFPAYANGKEQYQNHMSIIHHQKGVLQGEITKAKLLLEDLRIDLSELEEELAFYRELEQKRRNNDVSEKNTAR